ncbi:hypothetical protein, partial [Kingella potus]|uniref:hypothetical protein n=1 Tax=Kingella potus TaxID=265175 RepID=UPI003D1C933D
AGRLCAAADACVALGRHTLRDAGGGRMLFIWFAVNTKRRGRLKIRATGFQTASAFAAIFMAS